MIIELAIMLAIALFVGGATAFILMKLEIDAGRRGKTAYARWLNARYVRKFDEQLTDALGTMASRSPRRSNPWRRPISIRSRTNLRSCSSRCAWA